MYRQYISTSVQQNEEEATTHILNTPYILSRSVDREYVFGNQNLSLCFGQRDSLKSHKLPHELLLCDHEKDNIYIKIMISRNMQGLTP